MFNSIDGPGGRVCGHKSGYASLTRVKPGNQQDLRLSVVVQGPSYKWLVKISQISCSRVKHDQTKQNQIIFNLIFNLNI